MDPYSYSHSGQSRSIPPQHQPLTGTGPIAPAALPISFPFLCPIHNSSPFSLPSAFLRPFNTQHHSNCSCEQNRLSIALFRYRSYPNRGASKPNTKFASSRNAPRDPSGRTRTQLLIMSSKADRASDTSAVRPARVAANRERLA